MKSDTDVAALDINKWFSGRKMNCYIVCGTFDMFPYLLKSWISSLLQTASINEFPITGKRAQHHPLTGK